MSLRCVADFKILTLAKHVCSVDYVLEHLAKRMQFVMFASPFANKYRMMLEYVRFCFEILMSCRIAE